MDAGKPGMVRNGIEPMSDGLKGKDKDTSLIPRPPCDGKSKLGESSIQLKNVYGCNVMEIAYTSFHQSSVCDTIFPAVKNHHAECLH